MKKCKTNFLVLVTILAMAFSLAACGGTKTVEDYVNSEEAQSQFSTLQKSLEGSGLSMKISAEGNKMIYTYTYESIEKSDDLVESLETAVAAQDSTFQATADGIKKEIDADSVSVVVEYVDCNGEMIYSKEYTAK